MTAFADLPVEEQSELRLKRILLLEGLIVRMMADEATDNDKLLAQGLCRAHEVDPAAEEREVVSGLWRATWGVYGPFTRDGKRRKRTETYWEYRASFFKPNGETIMWVGRWGIEQATLNGTAPLPTTADEDARAFARAKLLELRRDAEPTMEGEITLKTNVPEPAIHHEGRKD